MCFYPTGSKPEELPPPNRKPDHSLRHEIPRTAHLLYRLNGDYNPLHADDEAGKTAGFDGVIMHGKNSNSLLVTLNSSFFAYNVKAYILGIQCAARFCLWLQEERQAY